LGVAFASDQGSQHASTCDPKEIGDHTAEFEVGILEELVHPVLALAPCLQGIRLRRDTVIPQWVQASQAAAASDMHAVHF